jgi:hypothetical protein
MKWLASQEQRSPVEVRPAGRRTRSWAGWIEEKGYALSQSTIRGLSRKGWNPSAGRNRGDEVIGREPEPPLTLRGHRLRTDRTPVSTGEFLLLLLAGSRGVDFGQTEGCAAEVFRWSRWYRVPSRHIAYRTPASRRAKAVMATCLPRRFSTSSDHCTSASSL